MATPEQAGILGTERMNMHRHLVGRTDGLLVAARSLLRSAAASVRALSPGVVGLSCLLGAVVPANAATPVVPLVTAHHHWEHHWFVWLPRHPVYESVEVMSVDSAGDYFRAVWVFFTERHGGKRQVHFFDNRRIVEHFPGSRYRPIEYERYGAEGRGQSVRVALVGLDDAPIEIEVDLADRPLTRTEAGLTDQSGHSADTLVLLFHRDRNALARFNRESARVHTGCGTAARRRCATGQARICGPHECGRARRQGRGGFGADGGRAAPDLAPSFTAVGCGLSVRVDHHVEW